MITGDRQVVRRLRRRVRAAVKADPALRRERRRVGRRRLTRPLSIALLRWLVPFVVASAAVSSPQPAAVLPYLVLWTLALTLLRAGQCADLFHSGASLWIFSFLPARDEAVFRHQVTLLARTAVWLAVDWLALGVVLAARTGTPAGWVAAPVFALAQYLTALAVAWGLARWRPQLPFGTIGGLFAGGTWLLLQFGNAFGARFTTPLLGTLSLATPGGWLATAQADAVAGGWWGWLLVLTLGTASAVCLWRALHAGERDFRVGALLDETESANEPSFAAEEDAAIQAADAAGRAPFSPDLFAAPGSSETPHAGDDGAWRERIDDALTTAPGLALFRRGWLEAGVTRLLSPRQRVLVDFLQPQGARWGRIWLFAFVFALAAPLLRAAGQTGEWLVWFPVVALIAALLPPAMGGWTGLQGVISSNGIVGIHAFLPIGFGELSGTLLRVSALGTIAALPILWIAIQFGFAPTPLSALQTFGLVVRAAVVAFALMPVWTILSISKSTNDTSGRWFFTLAVLFVLSIAVLVAITVGVALFVAEAVWAALALSAILLGTSASLLGLYGWAWGRGKFDLIAPPPR
ncbi:hypothetical protein [Opitutus sp. ER46]|uniref:hypothetical protein n=1 Tax=Opitutus sp. ER46 TaxID=2161864 RepID=UPI000D30C4C2|nr:hypothetical protein [Opitutus sp. ER46]PTX96540.1 hypothetical protein DB354_07740 [Opitutus sp. ER46]